MRHRFHSICPYFAMFPEIFVEKHLAASRYGGVVFDPFCGRGTTIFESLLRDRDAAGCDINPVAACIAGAKCDPPTTNELLKRIDELQEELDPPEADEMSERLTTFFALCFHADTYGQLRFLRQRLKWLSDGTDRFIAALCLGALHGESHRSPNYFSNRMPRTISTKPAYSIRWWQRHGYAPDYRDAFDILRRMVNYRFRTRPPARRGSVALADVRCASQHFAALTGQVTDVITSPPYLDTTNYREDQWLRLWFLGGKAISSHRRQDARHTNQQNYWAFLEEAWQGLATLLAAEARLVIRIGGRRLDKNETLAHLRETLTRGLSRKVCAVDSGVTTPVKHTQANAFRGEKPSPTVEHDFCFVVN
jgi:DNA methylase